MAKITIFFFLLIFFSKSYGNEVIARIVAIETKHEHLLKEVEVLKEQNTLKDRKINVLEEKLEVQSLKNADWSTKLNELKFDLQEMRANLNSTKESMSVETKALIENKFEVLNSELEDLDEFTKSVNVQESCVQWKILGISTTENLPVDPDGKGDNNEPIKVSHGNLFLKLF